ncbi:MAG: hypothetical protein WA919_24055 [Coleofasciculaceae cyanobacterium]
MLNKFVAFCLLSLGATFSLATAVRAEQVELNLSGTVAPQCSFSNSSDGTLAFDFEANPSLLASQLEGGSPAEVTVTCNAPASLEISAPTQTSGPQVIGGSYSAIASSNIGSTQSNNNLFLPEGATPLEVSVDLEIDGNGNLLKPGNYTYEVTLTVTP